MENNNCVVISSTKCYGNRGFHFILGKHITDEKDSHLMMESPLDNFY